MTRTVNYGGAVSLDGFLAGADGSLDWLHLSKDAEELIATYWKDVDTVLMGRKTYLVATANDDGGFSNPGVKSYVFSRTLHTIDDPYIQLISGDAVEFVRALKERPGRGIFLMGGGELAQSLLSAGLVDEISLNVHPILLGAGVPIFRDPRHHVRLTLFESRPIEAGCVVLRYTVKNG